MKTRKIRWLALLLVLLQLVLLLGACGGEEGKTTAAPNATTGKTEDNTTTAPKGEVTTPKTDDVPDDGDEEDSYLYLVVDGEAQYTFISSLYTSDDTLAKVREFIDDLEELTGATFHLNVETAVPEDDKEILIGAYANRPEAAAVGMQVSYTGYRVDVVGNTIVLSTYSDYFGKMLQLIWDALEEIEDGTWAIDRDLIITERDLLSNRAIPVYETVNGRVAGNGIYFNAYDGYTVCIEKTGAEEFSSYLSKLEALGYTRYDENSIGKVDFYTYTKDGATLYVQYNTSDKQKGPSARMTLTYDEWLPPTEEVTEYQTLADASINYLAIVPGAGGLGLGMVFQLPDGSFIIVDGGVYTEADRENMLAFLKANKPAQHAKPVISCWLWTHPHGDHVWLADSALQNWRSQVEIEMFAYNFVDPEEYIDTDVYESFGPRIIETAKKYYPDAIHWVMHAGQRLYLADTVVECLWSHEDVWPTKLVGVNDADTVFSITIDGVKTMMLGDCERPNNIMISWYGDAMKSTVVQNSHHTLNGPTLMYEYIDPMHSFWACSEKEKTDRSKREHAKWLLSTQWERVDENGNVVKGDRSHYHNGQTTTLYIKDLKAATKGLS